MNKNSSQNQRTPGPDQAARSKQGSSPLPPPAVKLAKPRSKRAAQVTPKPATASGTMAVVASGIVPADSQAARMVHTAPTVVAQTAPVRISRKPRLVWIGDALVPTGFATVTHAVLAHLHQDWEVIVSGVNYDGAAHTLPYKVLPAWQGGDMWGMNRFQHLCAEFAPAAVVINNDWWNVAQFARIAPAGVPVIGYMPVDGGHLDPVCMAELDRLHAAVWYTRFGLQEAKKAGFGGHGHVIPHGIDAAEFQPLNRDEARRQLGLEVPPGAFIVGNINRNQPRKRLDLTVEIFARWVKTHRVSDAYLLLHCARRDTGWDLQRLAGYHGVADRLILTGAENIRDMQGRERLPLIYSSLDLQMTTSLGEGWGLTTMEGMACGIPQIVPDSSALAEWAVPAVKVPCSRFLMNPEINTLGTLVDEAPFVAALQRLYRSKASRARLAARGIAHVRQEKFRWEHVAGRFSSILRSCLQKQPGSAVCA